MNERDGKILYSIIAPAKDEAGNISEFTEKCISGITEKSIHAEILIIDDGSTDNTREEIQKAVRKYPHIVRGFSHRKNEGITKALKTGFTNAHGEYLIWISPDLEADPAEIIRLFIEKFQQGFDVVAGFRKSRKDGKSLASWIYNKATDYLFKINFKDKNWVKGFHRKCLPSISFRFDWHRFILVMLHKEGFKIAQVETGWSRRKYGKSKFGIWRFPTSFVDAIGVWFVITFSKKPMMFFGIIGLLFGILGIAFHIYLAGLYFTTKTQIRPLFWFAILLEILATLFILFGFIAELLFKIEEKLEMSGEKRLKWWEDIN